MALYSYVSMNEIETRQMISKIGIFRALNPGDVLHHFYCASNPARKRTYIS